MKKNVLLYTEKNYGDPNVKLFEQDYFYRNMNPVAIITDQDIEKIPREFLEIFPIVFLKVSDPEKIVNRFSKLGVPLKNLIFWNADDQTAVLNSKDSSTGEEIIYTEGFEIRYDDSFEAKNFRYIVMNGFKAMKSFYRIKPEDYQKFLGDWYFQTYKRPMNWNDPQLFTEKILWMKLFDTTPMKILCSDKFLFKQYALEKIGADYVNPLIGVWDDPENIDLKKLPEQFVLKCNHGSGMNIIVKDKSKFNFEQAKEKLRAWLAIDYGVLFHEFHYSKVPRKIIAEEFVDFPADGFLADYKFHCFNGEPQFCRYITDIRGPNDHADFFMMNWTVAPFRGLDHRSFEKPVPKPKNFDLMVELARKLSKPFAYVRVDFFDVSDKLFVGELTFIPWAGNWKFDPPQTDEYLGKLLQLPTPSKPFNIFD